MGQDKKKESVSGPPVQQAGGPVLFENSKEARQVVAQQTLSAFTGPIPPAEILEKYNKVVPGLAETIVGWTTKEMQHRHSMELGMLEIDKKSAESLAGDSRLGLWLGFSLGLLLLSVACILAVKDQPWAAVSLAGGTLCGLVGTFVYGSRRMMQPQNGNSSLPTQDTDSPQEE